MGAAARAASGRAGSGSGARAASGSARAAGSVRLRTSGATSSASTATANAGTSHAWALARSTRDCTRPFMAREDTEKLAVAQLDRHDLRDALLLHRHAVEHVGDLDGGLVVRDQQELR